jgi:hypothetical protein
VKRQAASPLLIVGVFLAVIATIAVLFANDWGEFAALAFSIVWLGLYRKRRFAIGASLCISFAIVAVTLAFGSSMANVFGDAVFGAAVVLLFTMKRRPAADCARVLVICDTADAGDAAFAGALSSDALAANDGVCFSTPAYTGRSLAWNGIAAADEQDLDAIYAVGGRRALFAGIAVGVATGRPVIGHVDSDPGVARDRGVHRLLGRIWLANARRVFGTTPDVVASVVAGGYPSNRCEVLPMTASGYERLAAVIASERAR